jgi:hypothetical protein
MISEKYSRKICKEVVVAVRVSKVKNLWSITSTPFTILHKIEATIPITQLGRIVSLPGRYWEALNYYQKALTFSAVHRPSLLGAARILRAKGQWPRIHQLMIR